MKGANQTFKIDYKGIVSEGLFLLNILVVPKLTVFRRLCMSLMRSKSIDIIFIFVGEIC
jgi:hypothetical protein